MFIIWRLECFDEHGGYFIFMERWFNLSSQFSPSLGILFEGFSALLEQAWQLHSIGSHVRIVFVLLYESIDQIFPCLDFNLFQMHVPV